MEDTHAEFAAGRSGLPVFLQELAHESSQPANQLLETMLRAARTHLGMEIGFISEFSGDRRYFRLVDESNGQGLLQVGASDPLESSYCQRCVDGRLPQLIHDAQALPAAQELPVTADLGIGAHMSVPILLADGTVYGTFCCFSLRTDHTLNERDLAYLRAFAEVAGELLQREADRARECEKKCGLIRSVLDGDGLRAVWQPIVDLRNDHIVGLEALARFSAPAGCACEATPDVWFSEAGRVGMGEQLEQEAIKRGLSMLDGTLNGAYISVNVSAKTFLATDTQEFLQRWPLESVVVEITEHDVVSDYIALSEAMRPLRQRGLRLAVDDVGSGYASLQHMLRLNPDIIKLDLSIIRGLDYDEHRKALVAGMVGYARTSRSKLVAEGVETQGERRALEHLGVDAIQGYLLHKPQSRQAVMDIVHA